jgi:hypothetical protein
VLPTASLFHYGQFVFKVIFSCIVSVFVSIFTEHKGSPLSTFSGM